MLQYIHSYLYPTVSCVTVHTVHPYLYPTLNILLHGVSECIVNVLQASQYSFSFILLKFFVFYNIISFHVTSQYSARYNTIHSVYLFLYYIIHICYITAFNLFVPLLHCIGILYLFLCYILHICYITA